MHSNQSPYLGIDVGTRRIGVATCDARGAMAFPRETVGASVPRRAAERIKELCEQLRVTKLVVGWPLTLEGEEGRAVGRVRGFLAVLEQVYAGAESAMPEVVRWDERMTTTAAEAFLISADVGRRRRREVVDQIAAAHILKGYLDSLG